MSETRGIKGLMGKKESSNNKKNKNKSQDTPIQWGVRIKPSSLILLEELHLIHKKSAIDNGEPMPKRGDTLTEALLALKKEMKI